MPGGYQTRSYPVSSWYSSHYTIMVHSTPVQLSHCCVPYRSYKMPLWAHYTRCYPSLHILQEIPSDHSHRMNHIYDGWQGTTPAPYNNARLPYLHDCFWHSSIPSRILPQLQKAHCWQWSEYQDISPWLPYGNRDIFQRSLLLLLHCQFLYIPVQRVQDALIHNVSCPIVQMHHHWQKKSDPVLPESIHPTGQKPLFAGDVDHILPEVLVRASLLSLHRNRNTHNIPIQESGYSPSYSFLPGALPRHRLYSSSDKGNPCPLH